MSGEGTKHVLIVNSYHAGYGWSDDELTGLSSALAGKSDIVVYVEYADSQRHSGKAYDAAWLGFTIGKYRNIPLDLLIAADDYGAARALDLRSALNPNLPIVFCGVNDYRGDSWILQRPRGAGLVGIFEKVTYLETARLALTLLPRSKEIVVVDPGSSKDYAGDLQRAFPGIHARLLQVRDKTLNELGAELAKLDKASFVITSTFFADARGQLTSMESSVRWVTSHSAVPVFGISKRALGWGIVGGKLADGFFQGKTAGEMALALLRGTPVAELKNLSDAGEPYTVDYAAMQRWHLDAGRLPPGSVVRGRPVTLYQEHKRAVWATAAFLAFQFMVIGLLALEVKRRKRIEEALADTAQHYRAIFEQSPMGLIEMAADGVWQLANDKACEIVGESREQRLGKTMRDLISAEDWNVAADARADLFQGNSTSFSNAMQLIQRTGRKLWVKRTISLIRDAEQNPRLFMMTLDDITRHKEAEEQLLRSNATLRHFAYAAAHDLQEPLRNVALASDLLVTDYREKLDEVGQRLLRENLEGAQRMLSMVKDLLAYSVAVDSSDEPSASIVETKTALTVALQNLQAAITEAGVEVVHSHLPSVRADEVHVVALFQNLVGNAVKYRRKDTPAHVSVSAKPHGAEWIFEIADNGIGFEPRYAERIFGVFKRLHSRRDYPGTGIGLAICARIVEHYGGRIWAESQPAAGARFFFSLPAARKSSEREGNRC